MINLVQSTNLFILLQQLPHEAGDIRSKIIARALDRLSHLTSCMFRRCSNMRHLLQTDDVVQDAAIRLYRALSKTHPTTVKGFFGLAATNIRWTLVDLARKVKNQRLHRHDASDEQADVAVQSDHDHPQNLLDWTAFHEAVDKMEMEEREVVELLWYQGLTQEEAADVLDVSLRTIKRRWMNARIHLASKIEPPEIE